VTRRLVTALACLATACGDANFTVSGVVVDDGRGPVAGATVSIPGHAAVSTDAQGRFSVPGVERPFDLTLVSAADAMGVVYRGLTRRDPAPRLFRVRSIKHGSVSGTVSGGAGYPQPPGRVTLVVFISSFGADQVLAAADGSFSIPDVRWRDGSPTVVGRLHAVQMDVGPAGPVAYQGWGDSGAITLSEGLPLAGQDIALESPVVSATIDGSASIPAGYALTGRELDLALGEGPWRMVLLADASAEATFSFVSPLVSGAHYDMTASARSAAGDVIGGGRFGLPGVARGLSLVLPAAPALDQPAEGAAAGYGTVFSWGAYGTPGAVYHVAFQPRNPGDPEIHVVTMGTTTALPDLRAMGLGLPAAGYLWSVHAEGPWDDIESSLEYNLPSFHTFGQTAPRSFSAVP